MSRHTQRTSRTRAWGYPALGLFAAVWLNLALQPCAMALEADHDCPHCPPAHEHEMAAHHNHGEAKAEAPCASMQSQCGELDDASLDGRTGQLKVKDAFELPLAIVHDPAAPAIAAAKRCHQSTGPPPHAGSSPPRHVLFCVYLK